MGRVALGLLIAAWGATRLLGWFGGLGWAFAHIAPSAALGGLVIGLLTAGVYVVAGGALAFNQQWAKRALVVAALWAGYSALMLATMGEFRVALGHVGVLAFRVIPAIFVAEHSSDLHVRS